MLDLKVKINGKKIVLNDAAFSIGLLSMRTEQMYRLGQYALETVKQRITSGVGVNDAPMPPLSQKTSPIMKRGKFVRQRTGYAAWKASHGLKPFRDLVGTGKDGGHMLDNLTIRAVTETMCRMALTSRKARAKAIANERRVPFLAFSPTDQRKIQARAAQIFGAEVIARAAEPFRRAFRRAA